MLTVHCACVACGPGEAVSTYPASCQVLQGPGCNLTSDKVRSSLAETQFVKRTEHCMYRIQKVMPGLLRHVCTVTPNHTDARLMFYRYLQRGLNIRCLLLLFQFLSIGKTRRNLLKCITCRSDQLFQSLPSIAICTSAGMLTLNSLECSLLTLPHTVWRPFKLSHMTWQLVPEALSCCHCVMTGSSHRPIFCSVVSTQSCKFAASCESAHSKSAYPMLLMCT